MNFYDKVYAVTKLIPYGKVATYGQIASVIGQPRAARMVGSAMATCGPDVPWQRVINRHGMISIENMSVSKDEQADLLRQEGVIVDLKDNNYFVDLHRYLVDSEVLREAVA